jgi:hypothetical protein
MHFSPVIFTLLRWQQLGHPGTGSRPGIPLATLRVSRPPSLTLIWFSSPNLFNFKFYIFICISFI